MTKPPASEVRGILVPTKAHFRTNNGPIWSKGNEIRGEKARGSRRQGVLKQPLTIIRAERWRNFYHECVLVVEFRGDRLRIRSRKIIPNPGNKGLSNMGNNTILTKAQEDCIIN